MIGIIVVFHTMLLSGFKMMVTDPGDSLLVAYILENSFQSLLGRTAHGFWDPIFFYPVKNLSAYTEVLLGGAPVFWVFRGVGLTPYNAFKLWMLTVMSLNFWFAYLWLRRGVGVRTLAAGMGAFLFAFAAARSARLGHQQFMIHFYTVWIAWAITVLFRARPPEKVEAQKWIAVFFVGIVGQLYGCFYLGWFLGIGLILLTLWALCFSFTRERLFMLAREYAPAILVGAFLSALALTPLVQHYLAARDASGYRSYEEAFWLQPMAQSWFFMGDNSWIYSWLVRIKLWAMIPIRGEQSIGIGLVTIFIVISEYVRRRKQLGFRLAGLLYLSLFLLSLKPPHVDRPIWYYVYQYVPGANAVRGVNRIAILALLPAALGFALFWDRLKFPTRRVRQAGVVALALFCVLEQGRTPFSFDSYASRERIEAIKGALRAEQGRRACDYFYYSPVHRVHGPASPVEYHMQAQWASIETGVPTLNGYTGRVPTGWELFENEIVASKDGGTPDRQRIRGKLDQWIKQHQLDGTKLCWLQVEMTPYDGF
ncbi:MAG: hypothetical protein AB7F66_11830 [Bacteriovoracia bacterium]